jgi:hypothetical protein
MVMDNQEKLEIVKEILCFFGLLFIIVFILFLGSQTTTVSDDRPLFYIYNCEEKLSHTVQVSVIYANGSRSEGVYPVPPGKTVYCMVNSLESNQILDYDFVVDSKPPAHFRIDTAPRVATGFSVCDAKGNNSVSLIEFNS